MHRAIPGFHGLKRDDSTYSQHEHLFSANSPVLTFGARVTPAKNTYQVLPLLRTGTDLELCPSALRSTVESALKRFPSQERMNSHGSQG